MFRNWSSLKPGCGGRNIGRRGRASSSPPPDWPLSERAHCTLAPGARLEAAGDWPGESGCPPGLSGFLGKHPLVSIIPCFQVVNRCRKQPSPFKVRQPAGRRACRPSGPLFGNVCAHNKPDRQRFIAVFMSWAWFGLLLLRHSTPSPYIHTLTLELQIYSEWEGQGLGQRGGGG